MPNHSDHSFQRMQQRNLSDEDIEYVLLFGQRYHRSGALVVYLREKDIPAYDLAISRLARLVGTAVVLSSDGSEIITIWRNRENGLKHIRTKPERGPQTSGWNPGPFYSIG